MPPAADDQVLGASAQMDETLVVDPGEVAGVEPTVDELAVAVEDETGRAAVGDVAREHGGATDHEGADLAGRQFVPVAVVVDVDGLELLVGEPLTGRAGPGMVGVAARAGAGGLGQAVTLQQGDTDAIAATLGRYALAWDIEERS